MMSRTRNQFVLPTAVGMMVIIAISCTVVRHDELGQGQNDELTFYFQDGSFDAASYVVDIWEAKVLQIFQDSSFPLAEVLSAIDKDSESGSEKYGRKAEVDSPYSFRVSGSAKILSANIESAASTVELAVDGYDGPTPVLMQIGPVIRSSSVRDSLGFISFGDFTNQLEYAGVSKELNTKVRDEVVNALDRENLVGTSFNFSGAFTLFPNELLVITPVVIRIGGTDG